MDSLLKGAAAKLGSFAELARALNISSAYLAQMNTGSAKIPAHISARCAEILGKDPIAALLENLAENGRRFEERALFTKLLREHLGQPARGRTKKDPERP